MVNRKRNNMTKEQKQIIRELLRLSYSNGFDSGYSLNEIAKKFNITDVLYDNETNTGILWEYGRHGNGMLSITDNGHGAYASVMCDAKDLLESWSEFRY